MNNLQLLIQKDDWILKCWEDRYGRGIWTMIIPHNEHAYILREITDGGDRESMNLGEYLDDEGKWLPVIRGVDLSENLTKLNEKVKAFVHDEEWKNKVYEGFQKILVNEEGLF